MKVKLFLMILVPLVLTSCGSSNKKTETEAEENKTVELKPYQKKIQGYLSDVFEIVDGTYKIETKRSILLEGKIQVKIKSIGTGNPQDYGFRDDSRGPLYLTICDKDGQPIANLTEIPSGYESDALLKDMTSKEGEENWILFKENLDAAIPAEAATFIIASKQIEEIKRDASLKDETSDSDTESDELSSSSSTEDWDKLMDDYEEYVDQFIKMMEKANKEDNMDALMEYPDLIEKAKDLEKSLKKAKNANSLSSKQAKRLMQIEMKMVKAASKMDNTNQ